MAIPGTPLPVLLGLLFLVSLCAPPFESARSALMADVLEGDRYAVATSLTNITLQLAQVVGFLAAGALVAVLSPSAALLIDAATFAVSAAVAVRRGCSAGPRPSPRPATAPRSLWQDTGDGLRLIGRSPAAARDHRACSGSATMFAYASEGVAAPLVEELGPRTTAIGILLAANPLGVTIGGLVVARLVARTGASGSWSRSSCCRWPRSSSPGWSPSSRSRARCAFAVVVGLLFVSGLGASWLIPLNVSFVQAVPERLPRTRLRRRGQRALRRAGHRRARAPASAPRASRPAACSPCPVGSACSPSTPALIAYRRTQGHVAAAPAAEGPSRA